MVLEAIQWPLDKEYASDDSEDEVDPATTSAILGYFRSFVEQGTSLHKNLDILQNGTKYHTLICLLFIIVFNHTVLMPLFHCSSIPRTSPAAAKVLDGLGSACEISQS